MNEIQKRHLFKVIIWFTALFFAPVWIPVGILTAFTLAGLAAGAGVFLSGFLTVFSAVFGVPLLFSLAVTAMAYLAMKAFKVVVQRAHELFTRCMRELQTAPAKVQNMIQLNLKQFLKGLPIIKSFVSCEDNTTSNQPLYAEESETEIEPVETVVAHTKRPSMHFPFPKASLPSLNVTEDGEEMELFFNNLEDLYAVVCALRTSARNRACRRTTPRRNTLP